MVNEKLLAVLMEFLHNKKIVYNCSTAIKLNSILIFLIIIVWNTYINKNSSTKMILTYLHACKTNI